MPKHQQLTLTQGFSALMVRKYTVLYLKFYDCVYNLVSNNRRPPFASVLCGQLVTFGRILGAFLLAFPQPKIAVKFAQQKKLTFREL